MREYECDEGEREGMGWSDEEGGVSIDELTEEEVEMEMEVESESEGDDEGGDGMDWEGDGGGEGGGAVAQEIAVF